MKKISFKANKSIIAIIVAAVCLAILWTMCPIMYQNNDDKYLLYMMAGYTTGAPALETVFGGFLWPLIISSLYKVCSGVTWYTLLSLMVIVLSLIMIVRSFIVSDDIKDIIFEILFAIGVFIGFLAYFMSALQYTMTAAYVGAAGVCALIVSLFNEKEKHSRTFFIISACFLIFAYSIRKQMGLVTISCYAFILLYAFLKNQDKKVFKRAVLILLVFSVTFLSNKIYENVSGITEFNKYYSVIQRWIDYPHIDIAEDSSVYDSVGWDKEMYDAATEWFFLDERVSTENVSLINEASANREFTIKERIVNAKNILLNKQIVNVQVVLWFFVLLSMNVALLRKKGYKEIITLDLIFGFFVIASMYFCMYEGRFPLRVYQGMVLVYAVPSFALMMHSIREYELITQKYILGIIPLLLLLYFYKCVPTWSMVNELKQITHDGSRKEMIAAVESVEKYACEHRDNLYIYDYDLSQPAAPFVNYVDERPYNAMFWGGWTFNSPVYHKQLSANNMDSLEPKDLINSNVYLCGKSYDEVLYRYMQSVYGDVEIENVDMIGDVIVYRYVM